MNARVATRAAALEAACLQGFPWIHDSRANRLRSLLSHPSREAYPGTRGAANRLPALTHAPASLELGEHRVIHCSYRPVMFNKETL